MIALGEPKLKLLRAAGLEILPDVSMIALGGPKLKLDISGIQKFIYTVSMIALGGPKLKPSPGIINFLSGISIAYVCLN